MILRNDPNILLNDLAQQCRDVGDTYADAARNARSGDLAALFTDLAGQRHAMAADIARAAAPPERPPRPDPDLEATRHILKRLRAVFAPNQRLVLIDTCERADRSLAARLEVAGDCTLESAAQADIKRMRYDVTAALGRLAAAKARL